MSAANKSTPAKATGKAAPPPQAKDGEPTSQPTEVTYNPDIDKQVDQQDLPPKAETSEPTLEDGPRTVAATADGGAVIVDSPGPAYAAQGRERAECVVDTAEWGPHVGAAVPGSKVCSRHTMHFDTDGTLREPWRSQRQVDRANAKGEPVA